MSFVGHKDHELKKNESGVLAIKNYRDAYSFLVTNKSQFILEDAISLHLSNLNLEERLPQKYPPQQYPEGCSDDQVDKFIDDAYGVRHLRNFKEMAAAEALKYKQKFISDSVRGSWLRGAWHGVLGNFLTAIISVIAVALVIIYGYIVKSDNYGPAISKYFEQCVAPAFKLPSSDPAK